MKIGQFWAKHLNLSSIYFTIYKKPRNSIDLLIISWRHNLSSPKLEEVPNWCFADRALLIFVGY